MSKTIEQLKQIQADSYLMFLKLHNFHWNIKGMEFNSIHNYTEESYDEMAEVFDEMAERIIQLGENAVIFNADLVKLAKIKEDSRKSFKAVEVLEELEKDFKYFLEALRKLATLAEEENDITTQALAEEKIPSLEKKLWILRTMQA